MLISFVMYLLPVMYFVRSFPIIKDYAGCIDMPSSYNYSTADIPVHDVIKDISSFVSNFSKRFTDMNVFIKEHVNKTRYLDIKYFLFTPLNPGIPQPLNDTKESLSESNFNPYLPTTVIVHGYSTTVNISHGAFSVMKDYLLRRSPVNVIIVDYTKYCQGPYTDGVKYSYLVAMDLARFVHFIAENSFVPIGQFHFIGASMGAHISGNAGALLPGLGRITGLDPAGPLFEMFPTDFRLSYDDASFVDVIHTGGTSFPHGLGMPQPIGDIDFYPNGGMSQPGCNASKNLTSNPIIGIDTVNAIRCSHSRAIFLFLESLCNTDCQFVGINCDNYQDFENGDCSFWNSETATMGINAESHENVLPETKFYLNTNSVFSYCKVGINT